MSLSDSPQWGLQSDITPALAQGWYMRATGCITWLTGLVYGEL